MPRIILLVVTKTIAIEQSEDKTALSHGFRYGEMITKKITKINKHVAVFECPLGKLVDDS